MRMAQSDHSCHRPSISRRSSCSCIDCYIYGVCDPVPETDLNCSEDKIAIIDNGDSEQDTDNEVTVTSDQASDEVTSITNASDYCCADDGGVVDLIKNSNSSSATTATTPLLPGAAASKLSSSAALQEAEKRCCQPPQRGGSTEENNVVKSCLQWFKNIWRVDLQSSLNY